MSKALTRTRDLPSRAEFSRRQRRFVDQQGRTYVLPTQDDPIYTRLQELDLVDKDNYERQLRKGLAFDPLRELRELSARVMFYVQLPPPVSRVRLNRMQTDSRYAIAPMGQDILPPLERDSTKPLLLRELESNQYYTAEVQETNFPRRSKRGYVIVHRVRRVRR